MARRPGPLLRALSPPSAYAARKTGIWDEIVDRIAGAMTLPQLVDVDTWLLGQELNIPTPWNDEIIELMDKRREEIASEDIGQIIRDRFDFT